MDFDKAFQYILQWEGPNGEINENPNDLGGITRYGISLRFLKLLSVSRLIDLYGIYDLSPDVIKELSIDIAKKIYQHEFWDCAPFENINSQTICNYIFDMAISIGIAPAIKCAQRATWSVMQHRDAIIDDGIMRENTINMINKCSLVLLPALRSERASHYRLTVEKHSDQKVFLEGWLNRAYGT